jgi:hypothetical protein
LLLKVAAGEELVEKDVAWRMGGRRMENERNSLGRSSPERNSLGRSSPERRSLGRSLMSHRTSWETPRGRYDEHARKFSLSYGTKV